MESTTATKPRPTRNQPEVLHRAAEILYDRMPDYGIDLDDDEEKPRILKQIGDALRGGSNGYERAREMERYHGWMPDAQFVEWLDDDTRWDALREAQKAWVIANGIVPRLAVGAAVVIANPDKWRKDATAGSLRLHCARGSGAGRVHRQRPSSRSRPNGRIRSDF